jgi:hypothetical protein
MRQAEIRVLLGGGLPRLVSDMLERALRGAEGLELVGPPLVAETLTETVSRTGAHVVLVGLDDDAALPEDVERLVMGLPRVVGIAHATGDAHAYVLRPERSSLGKVVADEVPGLLRGLSGLAA